MNRRKWNIRLYYAVAFLQGMVFYAPVATLYRQARGVGIFDIALIESISFLAMIALEIPWGFVADRIGYRKTIVICNVLFFLSKIVFWKASGFGMFLLERLILSVVMAGLSGCDTAYLYISSGAEDAKRVFGLYEAVAAAGIAFASVVFSVFIKDDFGLAGLLTVASYGVAMVLSFCLPEVRRPDERTVRFSERIREYAAAIAGNGRFFLFLAASAMLAQTSQTVTVFLNQLQYLRAGIPVGWMGFLYLLVTAASFSSAFAERLSRRLGEDRAAKALFLSAGAACLALAVFSSPIVSVAGIVLLRASASFFSPIGMDIQNRQVSVADRATMLSVYAMAMDAAAAGVNAVFGKIADIGVPWAMGAGAVFCLMGFVLCAVWGKPVKASAQPTC